MSDSATPRSEMPDLRAPLVISVTGHRSIHPDDIDTVRDRIRAFLVDLLNRYPNTPLIVQTAMSPGADLYATEVALDVRKGDGNGRLKVRGVIPCREELYKTESFDDMDASWWESYQRYKAEVDDFIQLPDMDTFGNQEEFRSQLMYLSAYLIGSSQILLAIWDGTRDGNVGGTMDTVEYAHNGVDPQLMSHVDYMCFCDEGRGTGRFNDAPLMYDKESNDYVTYLNIHEDSLIYHIPAAREKATRDMRDRIARSTPTFYIPRAVYEYSYEREETTRLLADNVFGWRGTTVIPPEYTKLFNKINELNGRIIKETEVLTFDDLKRKAFSGLFQLDSYTTYMDTLEELKECVKDVRSTMPDAGPDELSRLEDSRLDSKIEEWRRESRHRSAFIDVRISAWKKTKRVFRTSEDGVLSGHIDKLTKARNRRNDYILKVRMGEKYKSTRKGADDGEDLEIMGKTLEEARIARNELYESLTPESKGADLDPLRYAIIDEMAVNDRDSNTRHVAVHTILTAFTSFFLALYLIPNNSLLFTALYVLFMVSAAAVLWYHGEKGTQANYLGYRLLAETLRVKVYWNILGISYTANDLCYAYLRNKAAWVRSVMTSWYMPFTKLRAGDNRNNLSLCECCWVLDQFQYHEQKAAVVRNKNFFSKNVALAFLVLGTGLSILSLVLGLMDVDLSISVITVEGDGFIAGLLGSGTVFTLNNILKLSVATANLINAAVMTYLTKMIYGGNVTNMHTKAKMFSVAFNRCMDFKKASGKYGSDEKVCENDRQEEAVNLFREIGVQSIEEVNSWFGLHRVKSVSSFFYKYKHVY